MKNVKIRYISFLFAVSILVTGCSNANSNQPQQNNQPGNTQGQNQGSDNQRSASVAFEGDPGSVEDLVIGQHVVVSGSAGSDGSVTALSIRIGEFNPDENFRGLMGQNNPGVPQVSEGDSRVPPEGFSPEEFQNLSEEERRARFEEMRAQGNLPEGGNFGPGSGAMAGGSGRTGGSMQIVQGEILDIDDTTITIKLVDGGSKLVFYSEETRIVKQPELQE